MENFFIFLYFKNPYFPTQQTGNPTISYLNIPNKKPSQADRIQTNLKKFKPNFSLGI